jgi:hypothetical protein
MSAWFLLAIPLWLAFFVWFCLLLDKFERRSRAEFRKAVGYDCGSFAKLRKRRRRRRTRLD